MSWLVGILESVEAITISDLARFSNGNSDTVLRVFGDHMMAHKRPSLSSYGQLFYFWQ